MPADEKTPSASDEPEKTGPSIVRRRKPQVTKPSPLSAEMAEKLRDEKSKDSRATKPSDLIPEDDDLLKVEIEEAKSKDKASSSSSHKMEENVAPPGDVDPDSGPGAITYTGPPEKKTSNLGPVAIIGAVGLIAAGAAVWILTKKEPSPKADPAAATAAVVAEADPAEDAVGALIKVADAKFVSGQITGEGGALEILLKAKAESPEDERVTIRLKPMADKFQELGEAALTTGRLEEAAAHFQNAIDADPSRSELAKKLEEIKSQL